jgi:DNA polymerase I-like protein with 3'-5' exonuclease and polymerase domains
VEVIAPIQTQPRGALVYASADYDGLELRTMAQACLLLVGESNLARVLNAGRDPHLEMAASMLGMSYEQAKAIRKGDDKEAAARVDNARQAGKVANFGFPGGLGLEKLVLFARKAYKVELSQEPDPTRPGRSARELKQTWLRTFPEFRKYFQAIGALESQDGTITLTHFFSNRIRGGATYTAACNSFFQGLGADATGNAAFLISEACYTPTPCLHCEGDGCERAPEDGGCARVASQVCHSCHGTGVSPLYGTRMVNYVHDEFILECPEERGHEVAHELVRLMVTGAAPYLPDVPASAEPKLMRFWSKDAKQVWKDDPGVPGGKRLIPWPKAA